MDTLDQFNRPLRDLRISVTDRCNFRCTYCMPAEIFGEKYQFLQKQKILTFEEIIRLTRIIAGLGAVKIRLTGGEPLVRQSLETLVAGLSQTAGVADIAMTTNAYLLPEKAAILKEAGLRRITVSLDSMDDAIFQQMNGGRSDVASVLRGIQAAVAAGFAPIKINCVVQRGVNDEALVDMARYCRENGHILRLIEYMDVGTRNGWEMAHVVPAREMLERIHAVFPLERIARNYAEETALRFRYLDGGGELGIIASVTQPFCRNCSRLRLSPEGSIYTCLFATHGTDLKTPMRDGATDSELADIVRGVWQKRTDRYSEERTTESAAGRDKIEMYYIGG